MTKKINFDEIVQEANNICDVFNINNMKFKTKKKFSSCKLDNITQEALAYFLPFILIQTFFFYKLGKLNDKLEEETLNLLIKIKKRVLLIFKRDFIDKKYKIILPFIKKIVDIDLENHTQDSLKKLDFIIFNDTSKDSHHLKSFSFHEKNIRNKMNFILKINSLGNESYHIRMGINIDTDSATIIDLIKKTG